MIGALFLGIVICAVVVAAVREADPYMMRWAERSNERDRERAAKRRSAVSGSSEPRPATGNVLETSVESTAPEGSSEPR